LRRERELVRLRADFISGVSHELRTPVAQIRMFGETLLLDRVRSSEERRRSLAIIVQESQRLTHLIDNVLHFSRSDRGASLVKPSLRGSTYYCTRSSIASNRSRDPSERRSPERSRKKSWWPSTPAHCGRSSSTSWITH